MNILGINCVYHESSAAIIINGHVVATAEEERFNRVKHAKHAGVGEFGTALLGGGHGSVIKRTGGLAYPNSIGFVWEN